MDSNFGRTAAWIGAFIVVVIGLIAIIGWIGGFTKTSGGEIAVVRNGGWFDDNNVDQVIDPSSGVVNVGSWQHVHRYPAQQRFYTITSNTSEGDKVGVDVVSVPSKDGVQMGIEGTFYFDLNRDHALLADFDNKFGTRQFRGADGQTRDVWDGDEGYASWLDQIIRPVIENALRSEVGDKRCAELVSSCVLVQNQGTAVDPASLSNSANIAAVQTAIQQKFAADLQSTLGGEYLNNIKFNLSRVTLPKQVQDGVDNAQKAFAGVSEAQARAQQALQDAQANVNRQNGYNACPICGQIDEIKAIPDHITIWAPGGNAAVPLGGR